jgi:transcriptional regulator with XRE-family HTH domain
VTRKAAENSETWGLSGVAEALRGRRKELGLSQRALAEKVGCHENTICWIENKRMSLTLEMFERICTALSWETWRVLRGLRRRKAGEFAPVA